MYALPPQLIELYEQSQTAITDRLADFARVPRAKYFYEMAYCILTPQSKAEGAEKAIAELSDANFFASPFDSSAILRKYVRFHNTKSERLIAIAHSFGVADEMLSSGILPAQERAWLVENVKGFGLKEASHFLRNIGRRGLAILDRHILNRLAECGVIEPDAKVQPAKNYFAIEEKFLEFSCAVGISMDELDLLFWSANTGVIRK